MWVLDINGGIVNLAHCHKVFKRDGNTCGGESESGLFFISAVSPICNSIIFKGKSEKDCDKFLEGLYHRLTQGSLASLDGNSRAAK